jgi:hypothetical protein
MSGLGTPEILAIGLGILIPLVIAYKFGKRVRRLEGQLEERNRRS